MKNRYRIRRDIYCGFTVEVKRWWLPFIWLPAGIFNTFTTVEAAERYALNHSGEVVKINEE